MVLYGAVQVGAGFQIVPKCVCVCGQIFTFSQHSEDTEEDMSNIYLSSDLFSSKSKLTTNELLFSMILSPEFKVKILRKEKEFEVKIMREKGDYSSEV